MTDLTTSSPERARAHARAQGGVRVDTMPTLPACDADGWPADVPPEQALWAETVAGGNYTALPVPRGAVVELTDLEGDACAHLALFNAVQTDERLNVADTIKVQWQAYLGTGQLLLSDRGRALATIVDDTSGQHDVFAGTSSLRANRDRYGDGSPHGPSPAGRELLTLGAAKFGLTPRDLPPTLSFFQGVRADIEGRLSFTGSAGPGGSVRLRAELPLVLLLANVPHPLDPRDRYTCTPLQIRVWAGEPATVSSPEAAASPEAERAFANTLAYAHLRGLS